MTGLSRMLRLIALSAWGLAAGAVLSASPATAAEVTSAQAAAAESQVRQGIAGVFGPTVTLSDRPVQFNAAGDHFDLAVPTACEALDGSGRVRITANARPGTDGTWVIDDIRIKSPFRFTYDMPVPSEEGGKRRASVPVVYTVDIQGQDGRIAWDPTFATSSAWTTSTAGMTIHTEGGPLSQDSKVGPSKTVTTLRPAGADRADLLLDGTLEDYVVDSLLNDVPVHIGMQRVRVASALTGLSRSRALALTQALTGLVMNSLQPLSGGEPATPRPKVTPDLIRAILVTLQDFASEFSVDETINGFAVKLQDRAAGMESVKIGLSAKSDGGVLQAGLELALDGLVLPDMQFGEMAALVPRKIALHPVVSGLGVAELTRLADAAADGREPAPADIVALFDRGGIGAALESMTFDVAGTVFSGQGKLIAIGPSAELISGTGQITAEHFDGLIQKLSAMPELAHVLPVLVFAKGAGRSMGDRLVWDLSYKQGKLLVNNVDLSAMVGGGASSPAPTAKGGAPGWGGTDGPAKNRAARPVPQKQSPGWGK